MIITGLLRFTLTNATMILTDLTWLTLILSINIHLRRYEIRIIRLLLTYVLVSFIHRWLAWALEGPIRSSPPDDLISFDIFSYKLGKIVGSHSILYIRGSTTKVKPCPLRKKTILSVPEHNILRIFYQNTIFIKGFVPPDNLSLPYQWNAYEIAFSANENFTITGSLGLFA